MTDEAKALVEHMRETIREWERDEPRDDWWLHQHDHAAAADLIETQAREIERLRMALRKIGSERSVTYHPDAQVMADGWREHCRDMRSIARAALGDSHDQ